MDCSIDCVLLHMDMVVDDVHAARDVAEEDAGALLHNVAADNIAHSPHVDNIVAVDNYDDDVHVVDVADDPN